VKYYYFVVFIVTSRVKQCARGTQKHRPYSDAELGSSLPRNEPCMGPNHL